MMQSTMNWSITTFNYEGPCKHCVAAALKYIDYMERQNSMAGFARRQGNDYLAESLSGTGTSAGSSIEEKKLYTTPVLKALLEKQMVKRSFPVIQRDISGKVCFEPVMKMEDSQAQVEFRIGITNKYVVKDVFQFAKIWREMRRFITDRN